METENQLEKTDKAIISQKEIAIDSYLNDTQDNPYGLQLASDMDSWLQSIPPHNRPALAAQMTTGAIQYICR